MLPERFKPFDPPARATTIDSHGSDENDDSRSGTPCDETRSAPRPPNLVAATTTTTTRKMNNGSPCCGKRPRSPRSSPTRAEEQQPEDIVKFSDPNEETQKYPAAAAANSCSSSQQQQSQADTMKNNNNNNNNNNKNNNSINQRRNDEGLEGEYVEGEPHAKVARSSPVVVVGEPQVLGDDHSDDGDDQELLNISQQHQEEQQQRGNIGEEEEDSKPPARATAATFSRRRKDGQQQEQEQREAAPASTTTKAQARTSLVLPLAANLREFMKPGATRVFRPRPEWYLGDQNGNPNSAHRRRATSRSTPSSSSTPPHHLMQGEQGHHQHQVQEASAPDDLFPARMPVSAAAAPLPFPLPPGLMVAPDSRLLSDELFDFVNPSADGAAPADLGGTIHQQPEENNHGTQRSHQHHQQHYQEQQIPLLSTFGRDFDPALHVTIREAATEAALALLEWGAPVEAENAKGVTPLILASQKGNLFLVNQLLRRGALPSRASSNGTTAVLQAAHFGHKEVLELLFRAGGVSLMEMANFNHTTPLMRAAQEGHVPIVQMLLDRGAAVNRRNRVQMTALMLASQRGHGRVCQVLVNKGAELDSMTAQHSTSLLLACKRGHLDVVRVLVTAGCELWVQDSRGRTAREVTQRRDMKDLIPLLDSNVQLELMQQQQRRQRNYDIVILWNLLQQERAVVPLNQSDEEDEEEEAVTLPSRRHVTIHQMMQELQNPKKLNLSMNNTCNLPPTLPYHLLQKSTQALLRTMALPAPLVESIAKFIPMPPMWDRRLGMLTKRSVINADATVTCALDLIDEVLEEGGFVEACDYAQVVPPTHFGSWRQWKVHCRLHCTRGGQVQLPDDHSRDRPIATTATVPKPPKNPSVLEMRRQVGFLQILANRLRTLANVLAHEPYNMPRPLIQQLITTSDIQSLVRRMGSRGVHFEPTVAQDLLMLVSRLCSWYSREREEKPYPLYPAVVHPPLPQTRQRPLPLRVPLDIVHAPFQYDPYQIQQPGQIEGGVHRESPPPPGPVPL